MMSTFTRSFHLSPVAHIVECHVSVWKPAYEYYASVNIPVCGKFIHKYNFMEVIARGEISNENSNLRITLTFYEMGIMLLWLVPSMCKS